MTTFSLYLFIYLFICCLRVVYCSLYLYMSVFLFTTFLKERFTSKQNMKWQDEMISFLLLLVLLLLLFLLLLLLLSFITCSKYFSSFYWLNPWLIIYNQIALTKFGRRLPRRSDIMTSILQRLKRGLEPTKLNPGDEVALF